MILAKRLLRKESKLPLRSNNFFIYIYLKSCVWLLLMLELFPSPALHAREVSKNEISENISQKFHEQW